jgi:transcriptional regulator with XRE-family HTH domain
MGKVRPRRPQHAVSSPEQAFGEALRTIRQDRGLSQEALGFESGYHRTYIGQLERGEKSPSLRTIVNLAGVLKVKAWEMVKETEEMFSRNRR